MHELHPGLVETYKEIGNTKDKIFIASVVADNKYGMEQVFEGRGRSKKQAKKDLALRILRQVHVLNVLLLLLRGGGVREAFQTFA